MAKAKALSTYRILDPKSLLALIGDLKDVRALLGTPPEAWQIREVGDGNLNLVFIVEGPDGSVCVKQALPYVRAAGPSWPLSPERAFFENSYYRAVAPYVEEMIPKVYHYDSELYCTVMERLSPHIILRYGLIAGRRYQNLARDIGEYVARACFFTSDFAWPFERKMDGIALFAGNKALVRITVDLIFAHPYLDSERNHHTSPQLNEVVSDFRRDGPLKVAVARFGQKFLNDVQALLHGDLHSGSVMVTETDTRVIDPEFAFYGPIGFDVGALLANLMLSYLAQNGHPGEPDAIAAYRHWLLDTIEAVWTGFETKFLALWRSSATGDAFVAELFTDPAGAAALEAHRRATMARIFADSVGFAGAKMVRRILGLAHVEDLESIEDPKIRSACETKALHLARSLMLDLAAIGDVRRLRARVEASDAVTSWTSTEN